MCDMNNHKSYGLGIAVVNEVRRHIVSMHDNIYFFFYQLFYYILQILVL